MKEMTDKLQYFARIMTVPKADEMLDKAFRRTKKKEKDKDKILAFCSCLSSDLKKIVINFPSIDSLPEFYQKLIDYTIKTAELKKALNNVNWAAKKISQLRNQLKDKRVVFGRVSSIIKHISPDLKKLDYARKKFDSFPKIKDMFTVCITGFPNVGKTTLLAKITESVPEIKSYAFTTKRINAGYLSKDGVEIQFLDTPGTLNRENKMNSIELQSFLAINYASNLIVMVFDPTFDLNRQLKLLQRIEKTKKPMLIFVSKTDTLADYNEYIELLKEKLPNFTKSSFDIIVDGETLKKKIIDYARNFYYKKLME